MFEFRDDITITGVVELALSDKKIALSKEAHERITKGREYLDKKLSSNTKPVYGINTGFGSLHNILINAEELSQLQRNLVISHACGMGDLIPVGICKLIMLLKIQGLAKGYSGIHMDTMERLIYLYNRNVFPVIFSQGSLGASGDLAPLAHLSLLLIGEGDVYFNGKLCACKDALNNLNITPLELKSKEGLALLNGTQFMSAYSCMCLYKANRLLQWANFISSVSLDAFDGRIEPFHSALHKLRPHTGQTYVTNEIKNNLSGSELISREKIHVQDPYSFRCIPQVHGASYDALQYCEQVFSTEINSVTDNPTIIPEEDLIISGGNFHGQPLALALDFLSLAVHELGNISERRTYQLISGQRGLPSFLVKNPGLNSGFMIPQYTAASIVSENKTMCMPASADSIVSSNGQEDHVSMGANAAVKSLRIIDNVEKILSIELLTAMQALDFRNPNVSGSKIEKVRTSYRQSVPFVNVDVNMHELMKASLSFIQTYQLNSNG